MEVREPFPSVDARYLISVRNIVLYSTVVLGVLFS